MIGIAKTEFEQSWLDKRKQFVSKWFATVGLNPNVEGITPELARQMWRVVYRDIRQYSQIACHKHLELFNFRDFGILKRIWKNQTVIGRFRIVDAKHFDNDTIARNFSFTNYNPNRLLN